MKGKTGKIPAKTTAADGRKKPENIAYLIEQLHLIKTACKSYDDRAAFAAFDRLKEKTWKPETAAAIEGVRDVLFLDSSFDRTAEQAEALEAAVTLKVTALEIKRALHILGGRNIK